MVGLRDLRVLFQIKQPCSSLISTELEKHFQNVSNNLLSFFFFFAVKNEWKLEKWNFIKSNFLNVHIHKKIVCAYINIYTQQLLMSGAIKIFTNFMFLRPKPQHSESILQQNLDKSVLYDRKNIYFNLKYIVFHYNLQRKFF